MGKHLKNSIGFLLLIHILVYQVYPDIHFHRADDTQRTQLFLSSHPISRHNMEPIENDHHDGEYNHFEGDWTYLHYHTKPPAFRTLPIAITPSFTVLSTPLKCPGEVFADLPLAYTSGHIHSFSIRAPPLLA